MHNSAQGRQGVKMKAVILAGGSGTRLWPLSRANYPKQFLKINSEKSLLQQSVERALKHVRDVVVLTNQEQYYYTMYQLEDLGLNEDSILAESLARNTAPAIALACLRYPEENLLVLPSDHVLDENFFGVAKEVESLAKNHILTFGVKPTHPATGYGYIKPGERIGATYRVERFAEKPSLGEAEEFLKAGYLWNSGIFLFSASLMLGEFKAHLPELYRHASSAEQLTKNYSALPNISIDYAVIEKSSKVAVVPFSGTWHDLGSWRSVYELLNKDKGNNAVAGDVLAINTENSLIYSSSRLIATIGLRDVSIVDTPDALLVAHISKAEEVKKIIERLKEAKRKEHLEGATVYRPWGYYTTLEEGERYKVKRLCIYPRKSISLQMHHHRAEHWIVVKGTAKVTNNGEVRYVHENESIYVPKTMRHSLENEGKVNLHIIETQTGEYLCEDDIVRYEDNYGRTESSEKEVKEWSR